MVQTLNLELDGMSAYLREVQSRVSHAATEAKEALRQDRETESNLKGTEQSLNWKKQN